VHIKRNRTSKLTIPLLGLYSEEIIQHVCRAVYTRWRSAGLFMTAKNGETLAIKDNLTQHFPKWALWYKWGKKEKEEEAGIFHGQNFKGTLSYTKNKIFKIP
jgi:hypothetical protein